MKASFSIAFAIALSIVACGGAPPRAKNIVIITLDTTRADRLPAYGFASVSTPALDRLARDGVVFNDASSVAPLTLTAHTSVFTGLYPPHHGVRDNADVALSAQHATLAEAMHGRGFRTGAFVGSIVLGAERGLARGFDVYDDGGGPGRPTPRRRAGNIVVDDAISWLRTTGDAPFLLWVHLYDLHAFPSPPDAYRRQYGGDSYLAALAFADAQIDRLLAAVGPRLSSTAVIVAGDHGESQGEHGEIEHGIFLYEATMHVPLIVRAPGAAPRRVNGAVSLVDIEPTVRDLVGLPRRSSDGMSLVPALAGRAVLDRVIYTESMYARRFGWTPLRAVREGRFKLIDAPRPELYDLEADPFEQHDLAADRMPVVRGMRGQMQALEDADAPPSRSAGATVLSPEIRERLASLGYTSGVAPVVTFDPRLDPKDFIEIFNRSQQHQH